MDIDKDCDERQERLKIAAIKLSEHFDSVQIFATRHNQTDAGGTLQFSYGVGNYFARFGLARHWVLKEEQITKASVIPDGK